MPRLAQEDALGIVPPSQKGMRYRTAHRLLNGTLYLPSRVDIPGNWTAIVLRMKHLLERR